MQDAHPDDDDTGPAQADLQAGTFYHASLLTTAPNPCLQISGLGLIGLPLNEREAHQIISCASLAPFGHGERTVVDKSVRDTWEIEPEKITFANPEWETYIKSTVISEVCKSLGVAIRKNPPRLELYKLLLYEKGSHFLPHQDTQKANGMFATVIIILPSTYTGGQVVVSHASTTETIDFAPNSLLSTALLAWYTDVQHEVKEVMSGYRLALSYNLIHDASADDNPCPGLPQMEESVIALRRILQKWKEGGYEGNPERHLMAYLLQHQYSTANLKDGLKGLKGVDFHRVTFLRPVAEELGFRIGLASLEHKISGCGDDLGQSYYRRGRFAGQERDTPPMLEVIGTSTDITGLVNLDGQPLLPVDKVSIRKTELIPKEPFKGKKPDMKEYEGYLGNGAGQLDHWYHRTVLVLVPEDKVDDICFSVEGAAYAHKKLIESVTIPPTPTDRLWAERLLRSDEKKRNAPRKNLSGAKKDDSLTEVRIVTLMDYALKWQDLAMWKDVMKLPSHSFILANDDALLKAWDLFSFDEVHLGFEEILSGSFDFSNQMDFLLKVRAKAAVEENQAILRWYQRESHKILSCYVAYASPSDVPTLISVILAIGIESFRNIVAPKLFTGRDNFEFLIAFLKGLRDNRQVIEEQEVKRLQDPEQSSSSFSLTSAPAAVQTASSAQLSQNSGNAAASAFIKDLLQAAASKWSYVYVDPLEILLSSSSFYRRSRSRSGPNQKVDRIMQVLDEAIAFSDMDACRNLFSDIMEARDESDIFKDVYVPLIPRLREFLASKQLELSTLPFVDFFQALIGTYLRDFLGKKVEDPVTPREVGCGCQDCNLLDSFILDTTRSTVGFKALEYRRNHLEEQLLDADDICTFTTIRSSSPHTLEVTKLPDFFQAQTWPAKLQSTTTFMASIGPDEVIAQIMGSRFEDVQKAIAGTKPFRSVKVLTPTPGASLSSTAASASQSIPRQAGKKRKKAAAHGSVIDLRERY